jgi:hypothetical protein
LCNYGVFDNGGRNNFVSKNLCVGYATCVRIADYNLHSTPQFSYGMVRNFASFHYRSAPYATQYPSLAHLDPNISLPLMGNCSTRETCGASPWHIEVASNVAVDGGVMLPTELAPLAPPRFNSTFNANATQEEVGFENNDPIASNCWGIKKNSKIFGLSPGFEATRLDLVGPPAFRAAYASRCT